MGGEQNHPDSQEYRSQDSDGSDLPVVSRRSILGGLAAAGAGALAAGAGGDVLIEDAAASEKPALNLVPTDEATHTATTSGDWSQASTWDNGLPGDGAKVHIPEGTTVTVDGEFDARIHTIRVDGTLRFATDTDTHLKVETIVTTEGSRFEIGTESDPIQSDVTAQITFIDEGDIDDPTRVSRGLLTMGTVRTKGQTVSPFHEFASHPTAGDTTLDLAEAPTGWEEGDQIVVPGVSLGPQTEGHRHPDGFGKRDEERTIDSVSESTVELDEPLEYDHVPPEEDLPAYVAHLDRNIRLESENTATKRRGHVMFMHRDVNCQDVGFYDLGRTDKSKPFSDPIYGSSETEDNPKARYSCHFHRTGIDTSKDPGQVEGCVVWGSPGWGFVNHESYANVRDCVSYEVLGAGFVAEAGREQGSYEHCIALRGLGSGEFIANRKKIGDFGHAGFGFWLQGPGVAVRDCVAGGHYQSAYAWWGIQVPQPSYVGDHPETDFTKFFSRVGISNYPASESTPAARAHHGKWMPPEQVPIRDFENNVAFASCEALRNQQHLNRNRNPPYYQNSHIAGLTAYNVGGYWKFWKQAVIHWQYSGHTRFDDLYVVAGEGTSSPFGHVPDRRIFIENSEFKGFNSFPPASRNLRTGTLSIRNTEADAPLVVHDEDASENGLRSENNDFEGVDAPGGTVASIPEDAARIAADFQNAEYGDKYAIESDPNALKGGALGNAGDLKSGKYEIPEEEVVSLTVEDVPSGTYDLWVRAKGDVEDEVHGVNVRYLVDPPESLPSAENWPMSGLVESGGYKWAKVSEGHKLDGTHEFLFVNFFNDTEVLAFDSLLLVRDGPDPVWPTRIEATNLDGSTAGPSVSMSDQDSDGESITVDTASNPEEFSIVIHEGDESGPKIGSTTVSGGENAEVEVPLDEPLQAGEHTLVAMLHEAGESGSDRYGDDHGPPITRDGEMVTDSATVTVEGSGNCVVEHFAGEDGAVSDLELLRAIRHWRQDKTVEACGRPLTWLDVMELITRWK